MTASQKQRRKESNGTGHPCLKSKSRMFSFKRAGIGWFQEKESIHSQAGSRRVRSHHSGLKFEWLLFIKALIIRACIARRRSHRVAVQDGKHNTEEGSGLTYKAGIAILAYTLKMVYCFNYFSLVSICFGYISQQRIFHYPWIWSKNDYLDNKPSDFTDASLTYSKVGSIPGFHYFPRINIQLQRCIKILRDWLTN